MRERLTLSEIKKITGKSHSTVRKICYEAAEKYKFSNDTITRVSHYGNLPVYLMETFSKKEFFHICSNVLEKAVKSDHNKLAEILNIAGICKKYHQYFTGEVTDMVGLIKTPLEIILDERFIDFCTVAMQKCKEEKLRTLISELMSESIQLRRFIK